MDKAYKIEGFRFQNKEDYERALKEKETIAYLEANTNMSDMKEVYQLYKRAIEKKSFQTVFGLNYLADLRKKLIGSGVVTEDILEEIPVAKVVYRVKSPQKQIARNDSAASDKTKASGTIKNFLIVVLLLLLVAMFVITYKSQYSAFTYFTDYKENMKNDVINQYENWQNELQKREEKVKKQEEELQKREDAAAKKDNTKN